MPNSREVSPSNHTNEIQRIVKAEFQRAGEERARLTEELQRAESAYRHWFGLMHVYGLAKEGVPLAIPIKVRAELVGHSEPISTGRTGVSESIREAIRKHPGIEQAALLDYLIERAENPAPKIRRNLRNMIKYLKSRKQIELREGGYYPAK